MLQAQHALLHVPSMLMPAASYHLVWLHRQEHQRRNCMRLHAGAAAHSQPTQSPTRPLHPAPPSGEQDPTENEAPAARPLHPSVPVVNHPASVPSIAPEPQLAAAPAAAAPCGQPSLASLVSEPTWQPLVAQEASKQYWQALEDFVQREWQRVKVYPDKQHIFRALNSVPLDQVKVVILGQVRLLVLNQIDASPMPDACVLASTVHRRCTAESVLERKCCLSANAALFTPLTTSLRLALRGTLPRSLNTPPRQPCACAGPLPQCGPSRRLVLQRAPREALALKPVQCLQRNHRRRRGAHAKARPLGALGAAGRAADQHITDGGGVKRAPLCGASWWHQSPAHQ